ncbi:unnamed protein product [Dovyalis caffra]|uniref:Uncharacterized protein n=1 Tax=Dovyalis caffra TaxID=77055 RepID=A0AAV1RX25_9ROSI|nr:unnamed protein product [Dovyalis caffra]
MAYPSEHYGLSSNGALRVVLMLVAMFFVVYIVGPGLFSKGSSNDAQTSCSCDCDCSEAELSWTSGEENLSTTHTQHVVKQPHVETLKLETFAALVPLWVIKHIAGRECGKHDPEISEEMQKGVADLISEEIDLQRRVANETLEQSRKLVITARITSSHYQIEAQKCSAHTETCEAGRERAEAGLVEERKLTALWEQRALELGWRENITCADNNTINSQIKKDKSDVRSAPLRSPKKET